MKVAITGGRDYYHGALVAFIYRLLLAHGDQVRVGDCPTGVDRAVRDSEVAYGHPDHGRLIVFRANWKDFGAAAGPIRNACMIDGTLAGTDYVEARLDQIDLLIAFPGGKGTEDCKRQARELGIPVLEVP